MFKGKTKQITDFLLVAAEYIQEETWNLGGTKEAVESDANQLAGMVDKHRVVVTEGNLAVINGFHNGRFAYDYRK